MAYKAYRIDKNAYRNHLLNSSLSTEPLGKKIDIAAAIEKLPEIYKTVVSLKYFEDLKNDDIAIQLDITPGAVAMRLKRAKRKLSEMLRADYQKDRSY